MKTIDKKRMRCPLDFCEEKMILFDRILPQIDSKWQNIPNFSFFVDFHTICVQFPKGF